MCVWWLLQTCPYHNVSGLLLHRAQQEVHRHWPATDDEAAAARNPFTSPRVLEFFWAVNDRSLPGAFRFA